MCSSRTFGRSNRTFTHLGTGKKICSIKVLCPPLYSSSPQLNFYLLLFEINAMPMPMYHSGYAAAAMQKAKHKATIKMMLNR